MNLRCSSKIGILLSLLFCLVAGAASADSLSEDQSFVDEVAKRLLAVAPRPSKYVVWPPTFKISPGNDIVARSAVIKSRNGVSSLEIVITEGLLNRVVAHHADRLAFILGHELGHLILGHNLPEIEAQNRTLLVKVALQRSEEM